MAKLDGTNSHNGAGHLGRGKARDLRANSAPTKSGRGGKVGTSAGVQGFDGAAGGQPGRPPKLSSGARPTAPDSPRGRDAGGRENMKAAGRALRGSKMNAPESGRAHSRPAGVHACDGTYTPKTAARKQRG